MTKLTEVLQMLCLARIGLLVSQHNTSTFLREVKKKKKREKEKTFHVPLATKWRIKFLSTDNETI